MSTFKISEKDRQDIIDHFSNKIKGLETEILHYQNLLNKLKYTSSEDFQGVAVGRGIASLISNIQGYELEPTEDKEPVPRQNWKQICLETLKEINGFSSTNDIYEFLIQKNPIYIKFDKTDAVSKISTALSNLYSKKEIVRFKNPIGRGFYWSLIVWNQTEFRAYYKKQFGLKHGISEDKINLPK